jgi:gamma-glutamyltranspeptidase/glutathione hydrolase
MVVAAQPEATEAGVEVLRAGGNAVDAAMACALVQGVVDPQMTGIAGFGSMQVYLPAQGVHDCIDFHARAPAAVREDMWADRIEGETRDGFGFILRDRVNDVGYQSIAVPGSLKAYAEAVERWGVLPWSDVLAPAISAADSGVLIRPAMYHFWTEDDGSGRVVTEERLRHTASGRKIYFRPDGSLKRPGDTLFNPDLAATLRRLADAGADDFYCGEIAAQIAADMARNGGLLTRDDLSSYRTRPSGPLWGDYRGYRVATSQPPGGGIMLIEMLNVLEHFDLAGLGHNSTEYIRVVSETMKRATSDKDNHVGDPEFVAVPVDRLLSKDYASEHARSIRDGVVHQVERIQASSVPADTTHVCVADGDGNIVTMTHSLGMPSGVITEGLGFMYNGCMGVFDPRPGRAGSLAPGKSRFSALCPTIVFKDEKPCVTVGAPGGTQIVMGVMQAILNVLDFGFSMSDAVAAPRFSATSNLIDVTNRVARRTTRQLEEAGYEVCRSPYPFGIAAVHGIRILEDGFEGGADPGRDGVAMSL